MLKKKYLTTPLIPPDERPPLLEMPAREPSFFRFVWILGKVSHLILRHWRLKLSGRSDPKERAMEIRDFVESMGGVWMKAGQVLAMRNDLFSLEFCNELAQLQDRAYAFPAEESVRLIEKSLGQPIEEVFDDFERKPFAAASLSQVHKARLARTSKWVAIKVQRPFAMRTFKYDFWWLSRIFGLFQFFDIMDHFHWDEMLREIRDMMAEELDYRQEAANMKQLKKSLRPHKVYVPKVFIYKSTDKVLVMEFVEGVFMSEYVKMYRNDPERLAAWLGLNDIDPVKVARRLFRSQLRQIYEDLLFHGDLHPGNIVLLKKNRLAFIDFGNVGRFDKEFANKYDQYLRAFSNGEMSTAADLYLVMAGQLSPKVDIARVKRDLIKAFHRHQVRSRLKNLPFHERSLAGNAAELSRIAGEYKFEMNWNLLKMGRALGAIDQNIGVLYPEVDYNKETDKYMKRKVKREGDAVWKTVPSLVNRLNDLSTVLMPTLMGKAMQFGGVITSGTRIFAFVMRWASMLFWVGIAFLGWVYIYQRHHQLVDEPDDFLVLGTNLHDASTPVVHWIDSLPQLGETTWLIILALVVIINLRLIAYIRNLLRPSTRLPGDSPGSS